MIKAKFIIGGGALLCLCILGRDYVVAADEPMYEYNGDSDYKSYGNETFAKGTIHYYSYNTELCNR